MNTRSATRHIRATPKTIAAIILDIGELADWNPALVSTRTRDAVARIGHPYPVVTRIPAPATLTYVEASASRIVWRVDVAGSSETGEWIFRGEGAATRVTHTMSHTGMLLSLMQPAMAQVPTWRLDRLQDRAEEATATGRT